MTGRAFERRAPRNNDAGLMKNALRARNGPILRPPLLNK